MTKEGDSTALQKRKYDLAFIGEELDLRGREAVQLSRSIAASAVSLRYNSDTGSLSLEGTEIEVADLFQMVSSDSRVLLEATTLGFAELAFCCQVLHSISAKNVGILYVEPERYALKRSNEIPEPVEYARARNDVLSLRDFSLTDRVSPYVGVPGWVRMLSKPSPKRVLFFLGFEGQRLEQCFEQLELPSSSCVAVFGVPAFRCGWETNAFANNINTVRSEVGGGIEYCGADNPHAVYDLIKEVYESFRSSSEIFLVPIGTKPHGIGVALFAAEHADVGIFYDFPEKRPQRSENQHSWHLFEVDFG